MTVLSNARAGAHLLRTLPRLLRTPLSRAEAEAALRARLLHREADFLSLVRRGIYDAPRNPCRALLAHAGCEPGDLARLVRADGVDGALHTLLRAGVYLTVDELKGRQPIRRGSLTLAADPAGFRNPATRVGIPLTSGGSRGSGTRVCLDLVFQTEFSTNHRLIIEALGGVDWRFAVWGVPGGALLAQLVDRAMVSRHTPQVFSRLDPRTTAELDPGYRWGLHVLRAAGRLAGRPFPPSRHATLGDPVPVLEWMDAVRERGETPHLHLFASAAVRLAQAALATGRDLRGVQMNLSGEPVTAARRAVVERSGAMALPRMGNAEVGTVVASGCLAPDRSDDMHVLHDLVAVIQSEGADDPGFPPGTLLASSIRPRAPLVFLNASLGDRGTLAPRACGCPLADLGWTTHLADVRSYEKLTAGGMTFYDSDLARVLEEVLPGRFGGGPLDYQLIEAEAQDGEPVLSLLVHPRLGPVDSRVVATAFLDAIGPGHGLKRVMGTTWREAGYLRIVRRAPEATPGGKILHLHVAERHRDPAEA